jgi:hypothetical protein
MVFLPEMNGYPKLCDTNKNMTKMGVIIKRFYCLLLVNTADKLTNNCISGFYVSILVCNKRTRSLSESETIEID